MSISSLKSRRQEDFADLTEKLKESTTTRQGQDTNDERFWKPTEDKTGSGSAVIRFLPAPDGETTPYVKIWDHGFQGPGGYYIENSRTTIGEADPVAEMNARLWNSGVEANKEQARKQKRRLNYIANIYVVKDPAKPENEGKVFLFKFGKKLFSKLEDLMSPKEDDLKPVNPFDLWEGANFRLRFHKESGYRTYEKSMFDAPSQLKPTDDELEVIWKQEHSLQVFLDPSNFKSYDVLKDRLYKALALDETVVAAQINTPATNNTLNTDKFAAEDDDELASFRRIIDDE